MKKEIHHGSQFNKIYKHGFWYLVNSFGTKLLTVFLLPIITRYVSPEEYGVLSSLTAVTQFLPIVISLYIDSSFIRFYYEDKKISHESVEKLYSTLFWFVLIFGLIVVVAIWVISRFTLQSFFNIGFWPIIPLITLPALFNQLNSMASQLLRAELRSRDLATLGIFNIVLGSGVSIILLAFFNLGIVALLVSGFLQSLVSIGYYLLHIRKEKILKMVFDFSILKRSLLFSMPLLPNAAGGWITAFSDRMIMTYFGAISQLGIYSIAFNISRNIYHINDAITQVQSPIAMSALSDNLESGKKMISEFITYYLWLMMFMFVSLTIFAHEILIILTDKKYHEAYKLIGLTAFPYVLSGLYRTYITMLSFQNKMWVISASGVATPIISLGLNFLLIPMYGYYGMALAFLVSTTFNSLWIIAWSQFYNRVPLQWSHIRETLYVSVVVLTGYIISEMYIKDFYITIVLKFSLIGFYLSSLIVFGNLRRDILPQFSVLFLKLKSMMNRQAA